MPYARINRDDVENIAEGLISCRSASELASKVHFDVSGLIKHIKKYRELNETNHHNQCGNKYGCQIIELCPSCKLHNNIREEKKKCFTCHIVNCNYHCPQFTLVPNCSRIKKFPYCCNGCEKRLRCKMSHFTYDPIKVWKNIENERSSSRKGSHASDEEFARLSALLVPLIKEKRQSLPQIYLTHKEEIRWSYPTLLKYIDQRLIPGLLNIDLTRRVRYPLSYKKKKIEPTNVAYLTGRTYDDFVSFISDNIGIEVVEMDTVCSCRDSNACLLTLLFRKSNFMLAFKLNRKDNSEVNRVFTYLKEYLGLILYRKVFRCILTDNGSEFADPRIIEFDLETGERLTRLFYCDPGQSGQKGKIEKNHVELRKIFPKGFDFATVKQEQINLALSHINSEPRAILNRNCPGVIAKVFLEEKILGLNEYQFIEPDLVFLDRRLVF